MWRTVVIIVALCGALAWFFTSQAPRQSGALRLTLAATFPKDKQADLGRAVARILPYCPGFARFGGGVLFTDLVLDGPPDARIVRIAFTVPADADVPADWGPYAVPCAYEATGDLLRIAGASCQALCLGKRPEPSPDVLEVDLNPKPRAAPQP